MDDLEGANYATRDWVKYMIEHTVTAPLARIEAKLETMEQSEKRNDVSARNAVSTRTSYLSPFLASLATWILYIISKKIGLF